MKARWGWMKLWVGRKREKMNGWKREEARDGDANWDARVKKQKQRERGKRGINWWPSTWKQEPLWLRLHTKWVCWVIRVNYSGCPGCYSRQNVSTGEEGMRMCRVCYSLAQVTLWMCVNLTVVVWVSATLKLETVDSLCPCRTLCVTVITEGERERSDLMPPIS